MLRSNWFQKSALALGVISGLAACATVQNDSVTRAEHINERSEAGQIPERASNFLVEAVDARRMDREEGRLAAERATTPALRQYGAYMVSEQTELLARIKVIAESEGVVIPVAISKEKSEALADLKQKYGEKLDRQFISMITIDHKRDVREFSEASEFRVEPIAAFARNQLPRIQSHLDQIEAIRKEYEATH